jgi:hypothetical protein
MTVSIPLVALAGAAVYLAWRYMGLRIWQAILCLIFGFLLSATTAAPEIHSVTGQVSEIVVVDQAVAGIQGSPAVSMTRASKKPRPCLAAVER